MEDTSIPLNDASTGSKIDGSIQCHKCQLTFRDAEHLQNHKCEPKHFPVCMAFPSFASVKGRSGLHLVK